MLEENGLVDSFKGYGGIYKEYYGYGKFHKMINRFPFWPDATCRAKNPNTHEKAGMSGEYYFMDGEEPNELKAMVKRRKWPIK